MQYIYICAMMLITFCNIAKIARYTSFSLMQHPRFQARTFVVAGKTNTIGIVQMHEPSFEDQVCIYDAKHVMFSILRSPSSVDVRKGKLQESRWHDDARVEDPPGIVTRAFDGAVCLGCTQRV